MHEINSNKIADLVTKTGKTQWKIASEIGIERTDLNRIISGKHKRPSFRAISKIANYFNLKMEDLQQ